MLKFIDKRYHIDCFQLLDVYDDDIKKNSSNLGWENRFRAVEKFRENLDCFFLLKNATYAVWISGGRYIAALRVEPYRDGYLITGLETAPDARRKGYATKLLQGVIAHLKDEGKVPVYSHVDKGNHASMAVHKKCGFQILYDYGVYLDGSVFQTSYTLVIY